MSAEIDIEQVDLVKELQTPLPLVDGRITTVMVVVTFALGLGLGWYYVHSQAASRDLIFISGIFMVIGCFMGFFYLAQLPVKHQRKLLQQARDVETHAVFGTLMINRVSPYISVEFNEPSELAGKKYLFRSVKEVYDFAPMAHKTFPAKLYLHPTEDKPMAMKVGDEYFLTTN